MGRKRSADSENRIYFSDVEEQAVKDYLHEKDPELKNKIYTERLHPALSKLVECVIKRYKLFVPDEEFKETSEDCIGQLMVKMDMFNPDKGCKAYSYFGTITKHYMLYRIKKYHDDLIRNEKFDLNPNQYEESERYADEEYSIEQDGFFRTVIERTRERIQNMMNHRDMYELCDGEMKLGESIIEFLDNWETFFEEMGSQKFNKASFNYYLKESTLMSAKDIRKYSKKFKSAYERVRESLKMELFN